jgi:hypothetical protein
MIAKTLTNIKQFLDYCPNCLICGKRLKTKIRTPFYDNKNRKYINSYLKFYDGYLVGENIELKLNVHTNSINQEFINKYLNFFQSFNRQIIQIHKFCITCLFEHQAIFLVDAENMLATNITFESEHLRYFVSKKHTRIELVNFHYQDYVKNRIFIGEDFDRFLELDNCVYLNQITNFHQLKSKLSTVISFY